MFPFNPYIYTNGARWQIELLEPYGTRLKVLDQVGAFQCANVVNNVGTFSLQLPKAFKRTFLKPFQRVRFWREPPMRSAYVEFEGFILTIDTDSDANDDLGRTIGGQSLEIVLTSRVIEAAIGSTGADKTGAIDAVMQAYVTENLGASASAERKLPATLFSVATSAGAGPSTTKTASYRELMTTLRELSDVARQNAQEVYFRIRPTPPGFEFRTSIGQPGKNRASAGWAQRIFGPMRNNLKNGHLREDWSREFNYVYALGPGAAGRTVTPVSDARGTRTPFSRREATTSAQAEGAFEAAQSKLMQGRPVETFTGDLQSVASTVYGETADWWFGDKVLVDYDDRQFPALVRSTTAAVDANKQETISATTEAYL